MIKYLGARLRGNTLACFALILTLAGGSYAAVAHAAQSSPRLHDAVTGAKSPRTAIRLADVVGPAGQAGSAGAAGAVGAAAGSASGTVAVRALSTGTVAAPHLATTSVPLSGASWTQAAGELDLVVGNVTLQTPSKCTGSIGNALLIDVDGTETTFALAPSTTASTTVTVPIIVAGIMEPTASTSHTLTASLDNSCTQSGEDFTVNSVKLDVVQFS